MNKKLGIVLALGATCLALTGCGSGNSADVQKKDDGKLITVNVYAETANYQGILKGWLAHEIKDKFNIRLKIISPNVSGGGDTLFDTRSAAGNLGDIVITHSNNGRAKKLVQAGLVSDMTPYLKGMKYIKQYRKATDSISKLAGKKGVWGIPSNVSSESPLLPSEGVEPTSSPSIRWDYYAKVGYPKLNTLDDLVPTLNKMQALARKENPGKKIYAVSLFKDWDDNMMSNARQIGFFYGYNALGFVQAKADGSDYQSIIDSNSQYVKALRFFNELDRAGLVDPDSTTQNYEQMVSKYKQGLDLFSFWYFIGRSSYNTTANLKAGRGFEMAPIKDLKVYSDGFKTQGDQNFIALGSKATHKQRLVKFINWLYSPEGESANNGAVGGAAGIEGWTWKMEGKQPVLTDYGKKALLETSGDIDVPASRGGGNFAKGNWALNYPAIQQNSINPKTGYPYAYLNWPSVNKELSSKLTDDWSKHMGGATTTMGYLKAHKQLMVAPGASYNPPEEDSATATTRNQVRTQIVNSSWKMVFASSDSEFNSLLKSMQTTVRGLGYDKLYRLDLKHAKTQTKERNKLVSEYKK